MGFLRGTAGVVSMFTLFFFLLGCGPANRRIVFAGAPELESAPVERLPSRLVLEKPKLKITSTCAGDCLWSDVTRRSAEIQLGTDVVELLGPQNVTDVDPSARFAADLEVRLDEEMSKNAGLVAVQIIVPLAMAAGGSVFAYRMVPPPAAGPYPGAAVGPDPQMQAAVTAFALSFALWGLVFNLLPANDVSYVAEARVTVRDRSSNRTVVMESTRARYEDSFNNYSFIEKVDRASGTALRLLEPKMAALISDRMRSLPRPEGTHRAPVSAQPDVPRSPRGPEAPVTPAHRPEAGDDGEEPAARAPETR